MSNPYLYLVMRGDLPSMNPGKLAAQASHGSSMLHEAFHGANEPEAWHDLFVDWRAQAKGFGNVSVVTATMEEIRELMADLNETRLYGNRNFIHDYIIDPEYPFTMELEIYNFLSPAQRDVLFTNVTELDNGRTFATRVDTTGLFVFCDKDEFENTLGKFKRYP